MNTIHKLKISVFGVIFGLLAFAGNASAAMDWTGITMDMTDVEALFKIVVPALIVMWGLRKVVKFANRS